MDLFYFALVGVGACAAFVLGWRAQSRVSRLDGWERYKVELPDRADLDRDAF